MKNFFYEKKVKQFDSFSVTYLTPCWGEYRKWGKENKNASYIKLSQAQTAWKAGMIIQTVSRQQRFCDVFGHLRVLSTDYQGL